MTTLTRHPDGRPLGGVARVLIGLALVGLVLLAARRDLADPHATWRTVGSDLFVGVAFVVAGAALRGGLVEHVLVAGVGVTWLLASVLPSWAGVHQGLLLLALASVAGLARPVLAVAGVPAVLLASGTVTERAVALAFLALAAVTALVVRPRGPRTWLAVAAATSVGGCLLVRDVVAETSPSTYDPEVALVGYEMALLLVAAGVLAVSRIRGARTGRLLADADASGVEGLTTVLALTLRDPQVRVLGMDEEVPSGTVRILEVEDQGRAVARIAHATAALDDQGTARAVAEAVRLTMRHEALRAEQQRQLERLVEARARIVAAADRQRSLAATSLREDVAALERVRRGVGLLVRPDGGPDDPTLVAVSELDVASREILALVAGVPPVALGDGRLGPALRDLVRRAPMPTTVTVTPDARASEAIESTAYFVCAEALTNAAKHAGPGRASVVVRRVDAALEVAVVDDGRGGADPAGPGLLGLADRVEAAGGRLRLDSPAGAGTTVTALLPVS